jgi:capsular polysaccharide transport system permease protein
MPQCVQGRMTRMSPHRGLFRVVRLVRALGFTAGGQKTAARVRHGYEQFGVSQSSLEPIEYEVLMLLQGWRVQKRVIGALIIREIQIRWGRRNLGFAWLIAEPLIFAFPVLLMWSYVRARYEHGVAMLPFLWSGYLPILMFRHVTSHAIYVVRTNGAMLYHRRVTPLDILIGRSGLELMGSLAAMASSFLILYTLGQLEWPRVFPLFLLGVLYMGWWSMAIALLVASASERSDLIEHIWQPISYMYMPISGFFYMADWLPTSARDLVLAVLPSLHSYEMIRAGLFGNQVVTYFDIPYVTLELAIITLIGLWLMRGVRQHLELDY